MRLSAIPESLFFRNNTGQAWQGVRIEPPVGTEIEVEPGMVILRAARPVKFGLVGSGDVVGSCQSRAVMVELKDAKGRQRKQQQAFELAWERAGGIYVLARTPREAEQKVLQRIAPKR